jgi:pimeloyl-ACP methyl ester carboxylesterase
MTTSKPRFPWPYQLALIVFVWLALSPLVALPLYQKLLFFPEVCQVDSLVRHFGPLSKLCSSIKTVNFKSTSNKQLTGCFLVLNPSAPVVLLSHGNAGNLTHRTILAEALLPSSKIVAYGESLGCGVAAELSKLRPVKAIVLQSGFPSLMWAAHDRLWFTWLYPHSWFPDLDCVSAVKNKDHAPLLIIHGTEDVAFSVSYAKLIYEKASDQKRLVIIKGLKHNVDWNDLAELQNALTNFRLSL